MKSQICFIMKECVFMHFNNFKQPITACKRHSLAAGATQGYDRLHANRYEQEPENPTSYLGEIGKI